MDKEDKPPRKHGPNKLNTRQRKYVAGAMSGKTPRQAALDAGYSPSVAQTASKTINKTPAVRALFILALEKAGITDEMLAQRLHDGLNATETKLAQKDGVFQDSRELIAFPERRATVELVARLRGLMVEKTESELTFPEGMSVAVSYVRPGND